MRYIPAILLVALCMFLFNPSSATADDWNRQSTAIFHRPVQIPGQVLSPGVYVFKLAEVTGDRNVVQIWNADESKLIATVIGYPEYVRRAPRKDVFNFSRAGHGVVQLKSWFHSGNPNGERFVYLDSSK